MQTGRLPWQGGTGRLADAAQGGERVNILLARAFFPSGTCASVLRGSRKMYTVVAKVHLEDLVRSMESQQNFPVLVAKIGERTYWHFQNRFYSDNEDLGAEAVYALLVSRQQRQTQRISRAQQIVAMGTMSRGPNVRGAIPDDVKQLVWTRDSGRCRHRGSTVELQFDHVIPVAMGGNGEAENLQILCGPCNRRKAYGLTAGS